VANAAPVAKAPEAPVVNSVPAPQPKTVDEYITSAPAEIQQVLRNGLSSYKAQCQQLIGVITANTANVFSKEQLEKKDLAELQAIAKLAQNAATPKQPEVPVVPLFNGQGMEPVNNDGKPVEPLALPAMEFGK
jgi:hypothetical protein